MEGKENERGRIEGEGQKSSRDGRKIGGMEGKQAGWKEGWGSETRKEGGKIEGRGKKSRRARWTGTRKDEEN